MLFVDPRALSPRSGVCQAHGTHGSTRRAGTGALRLQRIQRAGELSTPPFPPSPHFVTSPRLLFPTVTSSLIPVTVCSVAANNKWFSFPCWVPITIMLVAIGVNDFLSRSTIGGGTNSDAISQSAATGQMSALVPNFFHILCIELC